MRRLLMLICLLSLTALPARGDEARAEQVRQWTGAAVREIMTLSEPTWDAHKTVARKYFTPSGFTHFYEALDAAHISTLIIKERQSITVSGNCVPQITQETTDSRGPLWTLEVPVLLTYTAGLDIREEPQMVTLLVRHDEDMDNAEFLGIEQWIARPIAPEAVGACGGNEKTRAQIAELEAESKALKNHLEENARTIEALKQQLVSPAMGTAP